MPLGLVDAPPDAIPLHPIAKADLDAALAALGEADRRFALAAGFAGKAGEILPLADGTGGLARMLVGLGEPVVSETERDLWGLAALPDTLPAGTYALTDTPHDVTAMALGWALGAYAFARYRKRRRDPALLVWPAAADRARVTREADAIGLARDLINIPAGDLGPVALADAALEAATRYGADVRTIVGDDLLAQNYPAIHAVGRAAREAPRLVDFTWGEGAHTKVTLVGKGVCFDTGGLDLKPASGMKIMKKDMGGAANILALASMIMAARLPVRLRVLLPIVENAIGPTAFHPLDVITMRDGTTVEVGNTDAEGRLILADCLSEAATEAPDLLVNMCTLTGNARVALGPDLPALFTRHDDLAETLLRRGTDCADPLWRLPLWPHYRKQLDSHVAELSSTGESPFNGAINAAHFLAHFVPPSIRWAHIDFSGWNFAKRPGRPEGGEAQAIRALFGLIETHAKSAAA